LFSHPQHVLDDQGLHLLLRGRNLFNLSIQSETVRRVSGHHSPQLLPVLQYLLAQLSNLLSDLFALLAKRFLLFGREFEAFVQRRLGLPGRLIARRVRSVCGRLDTSQRSHRERHVEQYRNDQGCG